MWLGSPLRVMCYDVVPTHLWTSLTRPGFSVSGCVKKQGKENIHWIQNSIEVRGKLIIFLCSLATMTLSTSHSYNSIVFSRPSLAWVQYKYLIPISLCGVDQLGSANCLQLHLVYPEKLLRARIPFVHLAMHSLLSLFKHALSDTLCFCFFVCFYLFTVYISPVASPKDFSVLHFNLFTNTHWGAHNFLMYCGVVAGILQGV